MRIASPKLWHFDHPHLYMATVSLLGKPGSHLFGDAFGIRRFETRGTKFYLNGEPVALMGGGAYGRQPSPVWHGGTD
jgi:beta-glucuronidase